MIIYCSAILLSCVFVLLAVWAKRKSQCSFIFGKNYLTQDDGVLTFSKNVSRALFKRTSLKNKFLYFALCILAFLPIFLVGALRYGIGTAYFYTYVPNFLKIAADKNAMPYQEAAFTLLNRLIALFTHNPKWLFVVMSAIYSFCILFVALRYSANPCLTFFVLFFSGEMLTTLNNTRQGIAMAIILCGIYAIFNRDWKTYFIFVLIASLFHLVAIAMVVLYFPLQINIKKKYFPILAVVLAVAALLVSFLTPIILKYTKYGSYLEPGSPIYEETFNIGFLKYHINYALFEFLFAYLFLGKYFETKKFARMYILLELFAVCICVLRVFIPSTEVVMRVLRFIKIFSLLAVPYMVESQDKLWKKILIVAVYFCFYAYYIQSEIVIAGCHEVYPYISIFGKFPI